MTEIAITLKNVIKDYGKLRAVDHFTLELSKGEIFALVGPNGAGKTTVLKMILGILPPTAGEICVFGSAIPKERQQIKHCLGYLAQQRALYESLTARENIAFFGAIKGMSKAVVKEKTEKLLSILDLQEYAQVQVKNLSGGTQQRVALACACVNSPQLLLLDEATVGLDPVLRKDVWNYLREFNKKMGGVIIITTHFLDEADYADRVGFMRQGKLIAFDSPQALKQKTSSVTMEEVFLKLVRRGIKCE